MITCNIFGNLVYHVYTCNIFDNEVYRANYKLVYLDCTTTISGMQPEQIDQSM